MWDKKTVSRITDIAIISLKLRRCDRGSKTGFACEKLLVIFIKHLQSLTEFDMGGCESKLKNDLMGNLKVFVTLPIRNESLKKVCFELWIKLSSKLRVSIDALIYLEWDYLGSEKFRNTYELLFFANLVECYKDIHLSSNKKRVFQLLMKNLPVVVSPYFYHYIYTLGKQEYMRDLLTFSTGLSIPTLSMFEFKKNKLAITIKILARVINKIRSSNERELFKECLEVYVNSLNAEYWKQKDLNDDFTTFTQGTTRIFGYIHGAAEKFIKHLPAYNSLKLELSITDGFFLVDMCEQCNDLSEFVELLEGGYSSAIAKATLSEFESELFETQRIGFI
ncbi:unnamed protein product [Ambrosiozyma monospora]|uniref:Unnamed protein product n=1 Tax=Ambrosiozyma monospora TaxID=43982 RepID=A0ACB5TX71_AMBMO|nr:unnamed protein product [Ambrosiozyma monospora]